MKNTWEMHCYRKTYTVDFMTKKKVKNTGNRTPVLCVKMTHEAIVPEGAVLQGTGRMMRRHALCKAAVTPGRRSRRTGIPPPYAH